MNEFIFCGKRSHDFGIFISGRGSFNAPERDTETVAIPGKNGELEISHNRFRNIHVEYPAFIAKQFKPRAAAARAWLLAGLGGYHRLEDTYHPEHYRLARFTGPLDFESYALRAAEFTIAFDCKPQRFLKSGESLLPLYASGKLYNPTAFTALPLIRIYGTSAGTLTVGNTVVQIKSINEYVDLDCELQDAFKGITNCNGNVYAPDFPELPPGETGISFSGGITKIEIRPRWWTL